MRKALSNVILTVIALFLLSNSTFAMVGVGIGTGKIVVDENLKPGTIYNLPPINIINTGDEPSNYTVDIAFDSDKQEIRPQREWFSFDPEEFFLNPGEVKTVSIMLNIPIKAEPGSYFCYIEGKPLKGTSGVGGAKIGVAAAARLYFEVEPANILQGLYYRALSLWRQYQPWSNIAAGALVFILLILVLRKFIRLELKVKPSKRDETSGKEHINQL